MLALVFCGITFRTLDGTPFILLLSSTASRCPTRFNRGTPYLLSHASSDLGHHLRPGLPYHPKFLKSDANLVLHLLPNAGGVANKHVRHFLRIVFVHLAAASFYVVSSLLQSLFLV